MLFKFQLSTKVMSFCFSIILLFIKIKLTVSGKIRLRRLSKNSCTIVENLKTKNMWVECNIQPPKTFWSFIINSIDDWCRQPRGGWCRLFFWINTRIHLIIDIYKFSLLVSSCNIQFFRKKFKEFGNILWFWIFYTNILYILTQYTFTKSCFVHSMYVQVNFFKHKNVKRFVF